jgi:HD-GYP domain-containing protein (c-di-GMP phosphodiesterase class II)
MNLIPVDIDSILIGEPLPFHLLNKDGVLLARKSFVVRSRDDLQDLSHRDGGIFIDGVDAEALRRAYNDQLQTMLKEQQSLGVIAKTRPSTETFRMAEAIKKADIRGRDLIETNARVDWLDLQEQANFMLRDTNPLTFTERLENIHAVLGQQIRRNPDGALFALIYLSSTETRRYSATHAMLVSVMCGLASREVLNWPDPVESLLRKVALTMNVAMTDLQDKLAVQSKPPTSEQRAAINAHAGRSAGLLQELGITDAVWIDAVAGHHQQAPGALRSKTPAQRLSRLVQRADLFAARLSPRAGRKPITPAAAMQACYFDEDKQVDEAGAALIKAVGIYQPGAFVKLATEEIAVVVRRGANTSTPKVAVLINRSGLPTIEPIVRDSSLKEYRITASVPHREVRLQINLEKILLLTQSTASDRPL